MKHSKTGIYGILCLITMKWYVGKASSINPRWWDHRKVLRRNKSKCPKLQNAWNKYGEENFEFYVLTECLISELDFYEDFFVECFDSIENGYNTVLPRSGSRCSKLKLKSLADGEIREFDSSRQASAELGISESVLVGLKSGVSARSHGWCNSEFLNESVTIIDPMGNVVEIFDLPYFCEQRQLRPNNIREIIREPHRHYKGWRAFKTEFVGIPYDPEPFKFISPSLEIFEGDNLNTLSIKTGLSYRTLQNLHLGIHKISRGGWRKWAAGTDLYPHPSKQYKFVNPNGELIIVHNLTEFSKQTGLDGNSLRRLLKGEFKQYKKWRKFTKDTDIQPYKNREYKFINPKGEVVSTNNISALAKSENITSGGLYYVFHGNYKQYKGWRKFIEGGAPESYKKQYKFIDPNGNLVVTDNMIKLAKDNGLNKASLSMVKNGIRKQHKGWTVAS